MTRLPRAAEYVATYGTAAYILTLPLEFTSVWLHQQLSRFVLVFVGLAFAYLVVSRRRFLTVPRSTSVWLLVLYVVASLASWLVSRAPGSLASLADITLYPLVALLVVNLVVTETDQRRAWIAFLISGLGVALLGVFLYVTHLSFWTPNPVVTARLNITFGDPNITARFLTLAGCAAVLMFAARQGPSWLSTGTAVTCAAVVPPTLSRSGLVLFVVTVLLAIVVAFNHRRAATIGAVAVLVCVISAGANAETRQRAEAAVATVVSLVTEKPVSVGPPARPASVDQSAVDDNRRYLVGAGLQMLADHPAVGVGFGGYQHALLTTYRYFVPADRTGPNLDSLSHTTFVTVLAEQGAMGTLLFTVFFIVLGVEAWRARQRGGDFAVWSTIPATLIIPIFAYSQIEGRLFSEPYFWLALGLMYSANGLALPQAARASAPRPKYAASSSFR
jgi:hypothetical protein